MTTARAFSRKITDLLTRLYDAELLLERNSVRVDGSKVWWQPVDLGRKFVLNRQGFQVEDYLYWLSQRHFSAVLTDGSLLQFSYVLEGGNVVSHRLAYVPCPYRLDDDFLAFNLSLEEYIELLFSGPSSPTLLRSPIRFDYDPGAAAPGHAASHLTINDASCRIPCASSIHPSRFIGFLFKNFYPSLIDPKLDLFNSRKWILEDEVQDFHSNFLNPGDRNYFHLGWSQSVS